MQIGITTKINIMIVMLTLCSGTLLGGFFIHYAEIRQTEALEKRATSFVENLAYNCQYQILVGDRDGLAALFTGALRKEDIVYGVALDSQGQILYEKSKNYKGASTTYSAPVTSQKLFDGSVGVIDDWIVPLPEEQIGKVRLDFSLAGLHKELAQMRRIITLAVGTLVFVLAATASLGVRFVVKQPLNVLISGMAKIGDGNLDHQINLSTQDEMGRMAASFNQMAANLAGTMVSKAFLNNVFRSMNDTLIVVGPDNRIRSANQAVLTLTGYGEQQILGLPLEKILCPIDSVSVNLCATLEPVRNAEAIYLTSDGKRIPVLFSRASLRDDSDTLQGAVCVALDITERVNAEQALKESTQRIEEQNREMRKFLFISSHDLQEPLRKIQTFSGRLLGENQNLSPKGNLLLERLVASVKHLSALLDDLRSFSEVTSQNPVCDEVDLQGLTERVWQNLQSTLAANTAEIEIGRLPIVHGDSPQLRLLFRHLIANSLKFCHPERPLRVTIVCDKLSDTQWQISVSDNGIGFKPEYGERIFEVFQRIHGREGYEGTGMGLAICRKIAQRHGGDMRAQGYPGKGATFYLILPVGQQISNQFSSINKEGEQYV